jgi:lipopolysaccharide biosynthesis glycosyltransferase
MDSRSLAIVCWLWKGWRPVYTPEHVQILQTRLLECAPDHTFFCITDTVIPGVNTVPLPEIPWMKHHHGIPSSYYKLFAFSEAAQSLGSRILSIDLDVLILDDISLLIGNDDYKVMKGHSCPYNTSMFHVKPGKWSWIWDELSELSGKRGYGSDQAHVAHYLPDKPVWTHHDGIHQYTTLPGKLPEDAKMLFFAGEVKPWNSEYKEMYFNRG